MAKDIVIYLRFRKLRIAISALGFKVMVLILAEHAITLNGIKQLIASIN